MENVMIYLYMKSIDLARPMVEELKKKKKTAEKYNVKEV